MRKHKQLRGLMFRPISVSDEDSGYSVKNDFRNVYQNHMASMEMVAMSAKIYILNNWEKVKDWSNIEISVVDNSGKETYYYNFNYKDKARHEKNQECLTGSKFMKKALIRIYEEKKKLHNPVSKISNFVYDNTDGDFSFEINDKHHRWVDDETVIVLADYIEKQIKNTK